MQKTCVPLVVLLIATITGLGGYQLQQSSARHREFNDPLTVSAVAMSHPLAERAAVVRQLQQQDEADELQVNSVELSNIKTSSAAPIMP
ncbi:MAG: hypothetical protein RLY58_1509 [Pseudomonadota bacterium]|jgi:hypothetical protein